MVLEEHRSSLSTNQTGEAVLLVCTFWWVSIYGMSIVRHSTDHMVVLESTALVSSSYQSRAFETYTSNSPGTRHDSKSLAYVSYRLQRRRMNNPYPRRKRKAINEANPVAPMHPSKTPPHINRATPINFPAWKYCRPRPEMNDPVK